MLSALLAGALIVAASLLLGAAIMVVAGRRRHSAVVPAVGLSALLVVCGIAVKLPGHGVAAAIATGVALAAAVLVLVRSRAPAGTIRPGAIAAVIGAALVIAIPFAASGRVGILGQGLVNDDMASHLLFAEWVDTREGPTPDLVEDGYPLGPHAVVSAATKATGADLIEAFAGLTGALAVLAALTAFGALGGVRGAFRAPAAVLAAVPYLGAAYLAQGAFKEPMLALALVGFALSMPALRLLWSGDDHERDQDDREGDRGRAPGFLAAIPLGVIAAGTIYNYSFPGLAWLVLAALLWAFLIAWRERRAAGGLEIAARLRRSRVAVLAALGITVAAALPEVVSLLRFASFEAFSPSGEGGNTGFGNLRQPLNPLEAFGIWPSAEFRITPANASTPAIAFWLGGLLALTAFGWGLGRALARREAALPAAAGAGALGYLVALAAGTPYTSAKALAIAAPVLMLIALRGLLAAESLPGEEPGPSAGTESRRDAGKAAWWPPRPLRPLVGFGVPLLAAAFVAASAFSSLLPLRQAAVGPTANAEAMIEMRPLVDGDVLFLGRDNFISWELIGSEIYAPITNHYDTEEVPSLYRATAINAKFDWDNVPIEVLDGRPIEDVPGYEPRRFDWVVTTSAAMQSEPPPSFEPALESGDFVLWRRVSEGGEGRRTLLERLDPGSELDCSTPNGALAEVEGSARVFTREPVVGEEWSPSGEPTEGTSTSLELALSPGRWRISIQYASTQEMEIRAPGLERTMPASLLFRGPSPYYDVGAIEVAEAGPVRFEVEVERAPPIGRLLGTEGRAYLGRIAATPDPPREEGLLPLARACGRYLDWYRVDSATPPGALDGVDAPQPHPPENED